MSTDEKTGMQAVERSHETKPVRPGLVERVEFEYIRHGTLCLIANFNVVTGKVMSPSIGLTRTEEDFVSHIERTVDTDPEAPWIFVTDPLNTHLSAQLVELVARRCGIEDDLGIKGKIGILKSKKTRRTFLKDPSHRIRFVYTKICLTTGASGVIVDLVVESGNPADSTLATKMVERTKEIFGKAPRQVAFDGGFSSKANVKDIKNLGVDDVVFSKHVGLAMEDMARSERVFKKLRHFRAGIEASISWIKRVFGLSRCTWKGETAFKSYMWGSTVAFHLLVVARRILSSA